MLSLSFFLSLSLSLSLAHKFSLSLFFTLSRLEVKYKIQMWGEKKGQSVHYCSLSVLTIDARASRFLVALSVSSVMRQFHAVLFKELGLDNGLSPAREVRHIDRRP